MPIITAYRGSVELRAGNELHSESFYTYSKNVYGESLGELFDNLVEASVTAAEEARMWIVTNEPFTDSLNTDYWQSTVSMPGILKCQEQQISDYLDSASTMRVRSLQEIVGHAVLFRDSNISMAKTFLQLCLSGASNIPDEAAVKISGIHNDVGSLKEMTKFGWTGVELEEILEVARRENRITAHNAKLKYDRRLSSFDPSKSEDKSPRKKKWGIF